MLSTSTGFAEVDPVGKEPLILFAMLMASFNVLGACMRIWVLRSPFRPMMNRCVISSSEAEETRAAA